MKKQKINAGHYLELMDRLHIIMDTLNEHCLEHPLSESNEDIRFHIDIAIRHLWDAYQIVGNKDFENENENNTY